MGGGSALIAAVSHPEASRRNHGLAVIGFVVVPDAAALGRASRDHGVLFTG